MKRMISWGCAVGLFLAAQSCLGADAGMEDLASRPYQSQNAQQQSSGLSAAPVARDASAVTPPIVGSAPTDTAHNVKIHFYIDAHKTMLPGVSYERAAKALSALLDEVDNPIEKGLRERGVGGVAVKTGGAYLIDAVGVQPFTLAKNPAMPKIRKANASWDKDSLVKMILGGPEKNAQNVIVCVISNEPQLKDKPGAFLINREQGVSFFVLWAPKESVEGPFYSKYWDVEKWKEFLRDAVGPTVHDIANDIANRYYKLSDKEIAGLSAITCDPQDRQIEIRNIRSLVAKDLWKTTFTVNGKDISRAEDRLLLAPEIGQNKIVLSMTSPTGHAYSRVWETRNFTYFSLKADLALLKTATELLVEARRANVARGQLKDEVEEAVKNAETPMTQKAMADFKKKIVEFRKKIYLEIDLKDMREKITKAEGILTAITELDLEGQFKSACDDIHKKLAGFKKFTEDTSETDVESAKQSMDTIIKELQDVLKRVREWRLKIDSDKALQIAKTKLQGVCATLVTDIQAKRTAVAQEAQRGNKTCTNLVDLAGFETRVKNVRVNDISNLDDVAIGETKVAAIRASFTNWKPLFVLNVVPVSKADLLKMIENLLKQPAVTNVMVEGLEKDFIDLDKLVQEIKGLDEKKDQKRLREIRDLLTSGRVILVTLERMRPLVLKYIDAKDKGVKNRDKVQNLKTLKEAKKNAMSAKDLAVLKDCYLAAKKWEAKKWEAKNGGTTPPPLPILPIFVIAALVVGFFLVKKLLTKAIATITYEAADSTDGSQTTELAKNKRVNLASLGCKFDVNVVCRRKEGDAGGVEFCVTTPGRVWLLNASADKKQPVAESEVYLEPGKYQLFESEYAMTAVGTVEFESNID